MALISCPECRREVSDQAVSCPHCGYPIQQGSALARNATLDDTLRQLLIDGKKIAAVKLYRDQHPAASLSDAKAHVDKIEAAMPPTLFATGTRSLGSGCLLLFGLLLAAGVVIGFGWFSFH